MSAPLSRAILKLAASCMEKERHAWGLAMQVELEEAIAAGKPMRFALGCLAVSLCRMPTHEEGRFSLTAHALALGLMVPVATLQVGGTLFGFSRFLSIGSFAAAGSLQGYFLTSAYQALIPVLAALMLLLGVGQVRMAWALLNRDWARVETAGALTLAAAMTIFILLGLLDFDVTQALRQGAILLIELAALAILARWHAELPQPAYADQATG